MESTRLGSERVYQRHAQRLHFHNADQDYHLLELLSEQTGDGAALGECLWAAAQTRDGDPESWTSVWHDLAVRLVEQAEAALTAGRTDTGRRRLFRASSYHATAALGLRPHDPRLPDLVAASRRCFALAARLEEPPLEPLSVPFGERRLPGWFAPATIAGRRPTLIIAGGFDDLAQSLILRFRTEARRRGCHLMVVDHPYSYGYLHSTTDGQPPYRGLHEPYIAASVDAALERRDVDPSRIVLLGLSDGALPVARLASEDRRLAAIVLAPPLHDMRRAAAAALPALFQRLPGAVERALEDLGARIAAWRSAVSAIAIERYLSKTGASQLSTLIELSRMHTLADRGARIACPTLCLVGESDPPDVQAQAHELYAALPGPKALRLLTASEGADAHCGVNNPSLVSAVIWDWLEGTLSR